MMKNKRKAGPVDFTVRYNVHCIHCDEVSQPAVRSPLWWQAKQRADSGKLDALHISGEKCGCVEQPHKPTAPYRVFGLDLDCLSFDVPFESFGRAVKRALDEARHGSIVHIEGVSEAVCKRIEYGC